MPVATIQEVLASDKNQAFDLQFHGQLKARGPKSPATANIIVPDNWIHDLMQIVLTGVGDYRYFLVRVPRDVIDAAIANQVKEKASGKKKE